MSIQRGRIGRSSAGRCAVVVAAVLAVGMPGVASAEPSGGAGTAVPASASALAGQGAYAFQDLGRSAPAVDWQHRLLAFSGRLVGQDPAGGPDVPVAGGTVDIVQRITQSADGTVKTVDLPFATVVTDKEGRFSSAPKRVAARDTQDQVYPAGDFTVRMFAAHRIDPAGGAKADNWDTVVGYEDTLGKVSKVRLGTKFTKGPTVGGKRVVTAQGVTERQDGIVWRPVGGVRVIVTYLDRGNVMLGAERPSGADGTWATSMNVTMDGDLVVEPDRRNPGDPFLDTASVPGKGIQVGIPDYMTLSSGPYSITADRVLTASFTVKGAGDCVVEGQVMALQRSADGRTGWQQVGTGRSNRAGRGSVRLTGAVDGYYRWYHAANDFCVATTGYTKRLQRTATRVQSFNAAPEPVRKGGKLVISGVLQHRPGGRTWTVYRGGTVEVWLRDTKGHWTKAGVVKADANGRFQKTVTASQDGSWRAVHIGDGTHYSTWGALDHVDVR
ncbi:hypothetical protein ABZ883_09890 [Streptomyces sp. NPDC046977]|uniref:hypothetical protein n=1 Tax=Streptomyces sp. NPDC046977 TaxID=3154703 RepID=UPI0033E7194A